MEKIIGVFTSGSSLLHFVGWMLLYRSKTSESDNPQLSSLSRLIFLNVSFTFNNLCSGTLTRIITRGNDSGCRTDL